MTISNKSGVELGILGTHLGFLEALVPDDEGHLPRDASGELVVFAGARDICELSPVKVDAIQISAFGTTIPEDMDELLTKVRSIGLEPQLVMMVGGANPYEPADEDASLAQLQVNIDAALRNNVKQINSTSIEEWMSGTEPTNEEEFQARVAQNIKLHARAYRESGLAGSCVENWNIEFLRPGEFANFTSLEKLMPIMKGLLAEIGSPFFRVLVDAAHCGDSDLNIAQNETLIAELADAGMLGPFHCSVPTTRGCLTSDDGWIPALLAASAKSGKLESAFVELFTHDDPALQGLRDLDPGHGVDTTDGRSYTQVMVDGLIETAHRLNNFKARGIL
jgi:sugar phosphate isomerase/epimerase